MSKFLKTIVALILLVFIASGAGLLIPQFAGVDTFIVQENTLGNVDVGSAIYAQKLPSTQIEVGDQMLSVDGSNVNIYTVQDFDSENMIVTVTGGSRATYSVSANYLKVRIVIPLIGYLAIATQSMDGLLILAMLLILVIVLFICAEIIRRSGDHEDDDDADDAEYDDDDSDEFYRNLADKKRRSEMEDEVSRSASRKEKKAEKKAAKKARRKKGKADPDEDFDEADNDEDFVDGMTELSNYDEPSLAAPPAGGMAEDSLPDVQAALEAALESQQLNRSEEVRAIQNEQQITLEEEQVQPNASGEIELAMPAYTAEELLQKAYSAGLDPKVKEDATTGVTLVDFSDCL